MYKGASMVVRNHGTSNSDRLGREKHLSRTIAKVTVMVSESNGYGVTSDDCGVKTGCWVERRVFIAAGISAIATDTSSASKRKRSILTRE